MKQASVVIGANFGDEGKGLMTDFHAHEAGSDALVVRFNGGAQAGHTVVSPDGVRHVFSHFGSGALSGAATYLSRFFVANPLLYFKELSVLDGRCPPPRVYIDRLSPVTTPYDMLINQIAEIVRGNERHGSCGVGFGETIERNLAPQYSITVDDLADRSRLQPKLTAIRDTYVSERLAVLGITKVPESHADLLTGDVLVENFIAYADDFLSSVEVCDATILASDRKIVFEGAQGLLLDQTRGYFPHVTRSNTGIANAITLAAENGIDHLDVTYVTRSYVTRHGAGPLPHERPASAYAHVRDATNVPNDYQGTLRYARLDLDLLGRAIDADMADAAAYGSVHVSRQLAVTCLDQCDGHAVFIDGGKIRRTSPQELVDAAAAATGAESAFVSFGPSRTDIERASLRASQRLAG